MLHRRFLLDGVAFGFRLGALTRFLQASPLLRSALLCDDALALHCQFLLAALDIRGRRDTLGALASAAPELRDSLRTFLAEGCNASAAARRLRTHRNTLLRRLARAGELLPRPLEHDRLRVAVALEVLHWRRGGR